MRKIFIYLCCMSFFLFMPDIVLANQDTLSQEVQELKTLIMEMKNDYEARINEMQDKIAKLSEQKSIEEEDAELEKELELLFNDKDEQVDFDDQQSVSSAGHTGCTRGFHRRRHVPEPHDEHKCHWRFIGQCYLAWKKY